MPHMLIELVRQVTASTQNGHAHNTLIESRMSSQSVKPYYVWTCNSRKRYQCVKLTVSIRASQTCYCFKLHTALIESRNELSICQALRKHHRDLVITPQDPSTCATRDRNKNARKRKTKIGHGPSKESLDLALETAALGRGGGGYMRGGGMAN